MLIKVFTLKFDKTIENFNDEAVRTFMADKDIIEVRDHFFFRHNEPFWTVMLLYAPDTVQPVHRAKEASAKPKKDNYRALLNEQSTPLFNFLREWRNQRAMEKGQPPYVLFTNKQLALLATQTPTSLNRLAQIQGVGKTKLELYGKEILGIINKNLSETAQPEVKSNGA